tara:strand:- start:407 stop:1387 length:981 start_codon:yes stop_codon:yes gene_type:complete
MGKILKFFILNLCVLLLLVGVTCVWGFFNFRAPSSMEKSVSIIIKRGNGIDTISKTLYQAGVIEFPIVFRIAARIYKADRDLKAGEYLFEQRLTPKEVLELLQSGKTVVRKVTLAEGLSTTEILYFLKNKKDLSGLVSPIPAEGTLLPETYHYSYGDSRQNIIHRMEENLRKLVISLWNKRLPDLPFKSPNEAVILASIVEKETALPSERPRIAAVFINRIRKGMRLQSDPTVVYGLTKGVGPLGRRLTRSDLKSSTPYNTYMINGLPPGPIANPGIASLKAVMSPVQTDELYFVADGQGGHLFAKSLKQHNSNVARWRKINRSRK